MQVVCHPSFMFIACATVFLCAFLLVAFADFYDVSVEYLLGLSNSRKRKYHDISELLGLCDGAISELLQCKENSDNEEEPQMNTLTVPRVERPTAVLNFNA